MIATEPNKLGSPWGPATSGGVSVVRSVLFCSTCSGDIRGCGRRGSDIFFRDIGRCIAVAAGEPRSTQFLFQRLSIAIQRGNAASVVGTASTDGRLTMFFFICDIEMYCFVS